ncbi:MAG: hypothetical protein JO188_18345 [Hyphomicrobiales bacterium]|nr:hypothetical protein [Hyphomicrobiales bacterium]
MMAIALEATALNAGNSYWEMGSFVANAIGHSEGRWCPHVMRALGARIHVSTR